jgi:hypothetical protein
MKFHSHYRHGDGDGKNPNWEWNPGHLHRKQTCYQLSYCGQHKVTSFYKIYEVTVKKVENKTVFFKGTVQNRHLILWPGSQRRVHCHTAKQEPNQRVTVDQVPLLGITM